MRRPRERKMTRHDYSEIESYDLFDGVPPHSDDDTSYEAAIEIREHVPTLREEVYDVIEARRAYGATDDEIEEALGKRHQTVSARRRELFLLGSIVEQGGRRKTRSGRTAKVWVALPWVE